MTLSKLWADLPNHLGDDPPVPLSFRLCRCQKSNGTFNFPCVPAEINDCAYHIRGLHVSCQW